MSAGTRPHRTGAWALYWTALAAWVAYDIHHREWEGVRYCSVALACVGALLWLRYRLATPLSRPVYTSLVEAVRAQPMNTSLFDRQTGDRLAITGKRWLGLPDGWIVLRMPQEPSGEDAMSDFNLGQQISTIPNTGFTVRAGGISTRVDAVLVRPPHEPGRPPVPIDPPRSPWWQRLRNLVFVVRTGSRRVSQREASELIEQLRRAFPIDHQDENPEQEEA